MDEEFYYVEKLLDIKVSNKQIYVLTKWKNFSNDENTWEPLSNLHPNSAIKTLKDLRNRHLKY